MDDLFRLVLVEMPGPEIDPETARLLEDYRVGGMVLFRKNLPSAAHAVALNRDLHRRIADPILSIDQEGGTVARLLDVPVCPSAMALGAAGDPALTQAVGEAVGRSLRPLGFNLNFAPVADVNNNPANPVIGVRAFGADSGQVALHVEAFIQGQQAQGVAACAKHFPGHGDTQVDSHLDLPVLPQGWPRLEATELPPFRAAIAAGCATIMPGHLLVPSLDDAHPATTSAFWLQDVLRRRLGFEGVIVTDALNMAGITRDLGARAAADALAAGADLLLVLGSPEHQRQSLEELRRAVDAGRIPTQRVADALRRVEALRQQFPSRVEDILQPAADFALMEEAAARAITRQGEVQPLHPDQSLLLVVRTSELRLGLAATDRDSVAADVDRALQTVFPHCRVFGYPESSPLEAADALLEQARGVDRVLWLSASRLRPTPAERALANRLLQEGIPLLHLAVSSPYAALDLPAPTLLTYGFRQPSLQALLRALQDPQLCTGHLPIHLEPDFTA